MSALAKDVFDKLKSHNHILVTAESCTGGLIAKTITDFAGSSAVFDRGFVTYSNEAKIDCLGVTPQTLETYGAVSEHTAKEMVEGALNHSKATISISVTGIAGPGGGSTEKPVGLVYAGFKLKDQNAYVKKYNFSGDRDTIRHKTRDAVFKEIILILDNLK